MQALFAAPPSGNPKGKSVPRTAGAKGRSKNGGRPVGNTLNMRVPQSSNSQKRLQKVNAQNENTLNGRLEQNKYVTQKDTEKEAQRQDENNRRQRMENVNYTAFSGLDDSGEGPSAQMNPYSNAK